VRLPRVAEQAGLPSIAALRSTNGNQRARDRAAGDVARWPTHTGERIRSSITSRTARGRRRATFSASIAFEAAFFWSQH
jgi:hypothetical protein